MYKIIASVLIVLAVLFTWYVTQDSSSTTTHKTNNDDGIKFNP
jgi:hypothetical protein